MLYNKELHENLIVLYLISNNSIRFKEEIILYKNEFSYTTELMKKLTSSIFLNSANNPDQTIFINHIKDTFNLTNDYTDFILESISVISRSNMTPTDQYLNEIYNLCVKNIPLEFKEEIITLLLSKISSTKELSSKYNYMVGNVKALY